MIIGNNSLGLMSPPFTGRTEAARRREEERGERREEGYKLEFGGGARGQRPRGGKTGEREDPNGITTPPPF